MCIICIVFHFFFFSCLRADFIAYYYIIFGKKPVFSHDVYNDFFSRSTTAYKAAYTQSPPYQYSEFKKIKEDSTIFYVWRVHEKIRRSIYETYIRKSTLKTHSVRAHIIDTGYFFLYFYSSIMAFMRGEPARSIMLGYG